MFKRWMGILFAAALAMPSISSVQAATVNFAISDDPTADILGRTHLGGTLTGTLYGLADNGFSMPTSVLITSDVSGFTMAGNLFALSATLGSGFELTNGTVVGANVFVNFNDDNNGHFQFRFNFTDPSSPVYNYLIRNDGNGPFVGIGNQGGFTGVTYTTVSAVPEPSTWAMLILGFACIGFVTYRRNCTARSHTCRVFGLNNQDA